MSANSSSSYRSGGSKEVDSSRLWFEVIMQALKETLAGNTEARAWLYSDDFLICCNLAGFHNMDGIRSMIEKALRDPTPLIH
jgi:hypothetical protein